MGAGRELAGRAGPVPVAAAIAGGGQEDVPLEGVVVVDDPVLVRKQARDLAWREQHGAVFGTCGGWS